jgi:hypothetical protein
LEDELHAVKDRIKVVETDLRDTIDSRKACVTGSEDWKTLTTLELAMRDELKQLRDEKARKEVALDRALSGSAGEDHLLCRMRRLRQAVC